MVGLVDGPVDEAEVAGTGKGMDDGSRRRSLSSCRSCMHDQFGSNFPCASQAIDYFPALKLIACCQHRQ